MTQKEPKEANRIISLVIMAAGLASRFGGDKQITPVDDAGQMILDYSLYDAKKAGFEQVIFVIRPEMKQRFHELVGIRAEKLMKVHYAFQTMERFLPEGVSIPDGRTKPWGTGHAALCAKEFIQGPFAVINADDFYGRSAFEEIYGFLSRDVKPDEMAMIGYRIENTLTENGTVARGVCETDENAFLTDINERTAISPWKDGARYTLDGGKTYTEVPRGTLVSMNLWGFDADFIRTLEDHFAPWLKENLPLNPLKCEYFLPYLPHLMVQAHQARVRVIPTREKWYGMTYQEDLEGVRKAIRSMKEAGKYPDKLF